ncbi:MAG: NifX-associated nitrogen fixation protein [Halorhodospira sp.]
MWTWNPQQEPAHHETRERVLAPDDPALATPFVRELVRQVRATDTFGAWEHYDDAAVIDPFILTPERKRAIPVVADPDGETVNRVRAFFNAVAARIEADTGVMAVPVINLSHEGFGRAFVLAGRLVAVDKPLRDVHRFGFPQAAKLARRGEALVEAGIALVERYPEVARG